MPSPPERPGRPDRSSPPSFPLAGEILGAFWNSDPVEARRLGLFRYAGRLPDLSRGAVSRRAAELDRQILLLGAIDGLEGLSELERRVLLTALEAERFRIRDWRTFSRYPLVYLDRIDVTDYLQRDFAPWEERAAALALHLEEIPRLLDDARGNLDLELDRTVLETSIRHFRAFGAFLETDLRSAISDRSPADFALHGAAGEATAGVRDFVAFLESREVSARGGHFPIGAELLCGLLRTGEGLDVDLDHLFARGEDELRRNRELLREATRAIDPHAPSEEVVARVKAHHPPVADLVPETRRLEKELRDWVATRGVVSVPADTPCRVEETPEFLSWAFAMVDIVPPLSERAFEGTYWVTPPRPDATPTERDEWLGELSYAGLRNTTVHEAWPGHFLHMLHIRENPSEVLRTFGCYSSFEAWAHYCEEMMWEEGYSDDPAVRVVQIGDALLRCVRLLGSIRMHTRRASLDDVAESFRRDALLGGAAARAEAERGTFDPGYANYTLGKLMLRKLRQDWRSRAGAEPPLRDFHDAFLRGAAAPVPLVRSLIFGFDGDPL